MTKLEEQLRRADEIPVEDRWEEIRGRQPVRSGPTSAVGFRRWTTVIVALAIGALAFAVVALAFRGTVTRKPSGLGTLQSTSPAVEARVAGRVDVGANAYSVAAADGQVWVATYDFDHGSAAVVHVDAATGRVAATIPIDGFAYNIAAGDGAAWVVTDTPNGAPSLVRIDAATDRITDSVPNITGPVIVDSSGVWAAEQKAIVQIDPVTLSIEARIPNARPPLDMAAGGGTLWVLETEIQKDTGVSAGSLVRIDEATATVSDTVSDLSLSGIWIAASQDGAWVSAWRPNALDSAAAFFVPASGAPPREAGDVYNFRPFVVAEGRAWFISGPHDKGLPNGGGVCGLNASTHEVDTCAAPRSIADLEAAHDPVDFDPVTSTFWVGEYESNFVTKIQVVPSSSPGPRP